MQRDKSKTVLSFIELLQQCIVFLAAIYAVYFGLFKLHEEALFYGLWVPAVVVLAFFSRKCVKQFSVFIVLNFFIFAAAFFTAFRDEMLLSNIIMALVISVYSFKLKNHQISLATDQNMPIRDGYTAQQAKEKALKSMLTSEAVPIYAIAVMIIGYILGSIQNIEILMTLEAFLSIIFVLLELIHNNAQHIYQLFQLNKDKADFPAGQLKQVNRYTNVVCITLILFSMLAFYNGQYGNIFSLMGAGFYRIIRLIVGAFLFLLGRGGSDSISEPIPEEETEEETKIENGLEYPDSPILEAAAETVGFVLLLALLAGITYMVLTYIKNFNKTKREGLDYVEFLKPNEKKESVNKLKRETAYKDSKSVKSVRKLYKMSILKGTKGKPPELSSTPSKLTVDNITKDESKAAKITEIYEKARYSEEQITEEDTELIKKYINSQH